jgi:hypothetical protein
MDNVSLMHELDSIDELCGVMTSRLDIE